MSGMKVPEAFRLKKEGTVFETKTGDPVGLFFIPGRHAKGRGLKVVAADGEMTGGWEHVSVSIADSSSKCPSWEEMCIVKNLFWEPDACVVQFHPAKENYVNIHPGVLHLWRCTGTPFPTPPLICV